jgi:hypothetical protein
MHDPTDDDDGMPDLLRDSSFLNVGAYVLVDNDPKKRATLLYENENGTWDIEYDLFEEEVHQNLISIHILG